MTARTVALIATAMFMAVESAAAQAPDLAAPKAVLSQLAGTWSFQLFVRGRAQPFGKGRREMTLLPDSLKLSWSQQVEGSSVTAAGFLGYDDHFESYYLMGVQTDRSAPMLLRGVATTDTIRFDPAATAGSYGNPPGTYILSEIRILSPDRFEWVAIDGDWRVEFTRAGAP